MGIRRTLYSAYEPLERLIAPGLRYSQDIYEEILSGLAKKTDRWLDLGCGHRILSEWREKQEEELFKSCKMVVGLDFDHSSLKRHRSIQLRVRGNIRQLPFANEEFDLVSANMVVEHLEHPEAQFKEIQRILKPGGQFLLHTPNFLGYQTILARLFPEWLKRRIIFLLEGRKAEDVFKTYYRANTERRITHIASATGFQIVRIRKIVTSAEFALILPLAIVELLWIRILMMPPFGSLRSNLIAVLRKSEGCGSSPCP